MNILLHFISQNTTNNKNHIFTTKSSRKLVNLHYIMTIYLSTCLIREFYMQTSGQCTKIKNNMEGGILRQVKENEEEGQRKGRIKEAEQQPEMKDRQPREKKERRRRRKTRGGEGFTLLVHNTNVSGTALGTHEAHHVCTQRHGPEAPAQMHAT